LLLCLLTLSAGYTQTCSIRSKASVLFSISDNFEQEKAVYYSIEFSFNGVPVKTSSEDTTTIPVNPNGLDTIQYSYLWEGERIEEIGLCKFGANEPCVVSPCVCCGIFLVVPEKHPERGFVQFVNKCKTPYEVSTSEIESDRLEGNSKAPFR